MAIVKMKRLRLISMVSDRDELLRLLQSMGCVELSEPSLAEDDPLKAALSRPEYTGFAAAREEQTEAERALLILKRHAPEKGSFLQPKPGLHEGELFDQNAIQPARHSHIS